VFDAFREKQCVITSDTNYQLSFDSEVVRVNCDKQKHLRVQRSIEKYDPYAIDDILFALRSCDNAKEQKAFGYIKVLMQYKSPVKKRMSIPEVIEFNDIVHNVGYELHRFKGLLRFMENRDGVLYAPYAPDNDITDLLMPHFAARFKAEKFVIHDIKRKIAGMYDGHEWILCYADEAEIYLSENERTLENLWKKYYSSVNIKERPHEKQMKCYMPVRYWKFLPEKNGH